MAKIHVQAYVEPVEIAKVAKIINDRIPAMERARAGLRINMSNIVRFALAQVALSENSIPINMDSESATDELLKWVDEPPRNLLKKQFLSEKETLMKTLVGGYGSITAEDMRRYAAGAPAIAMKAIAVETAEAKQNIISVPFDKSRLRTEIINGEEAIAREQDDNTFSQQEMEELESFVKELSAAELADKITSIQADEMREAKITEIKERKRSHVNTD